MLILICLVCQTPSKAQNFNVFLKTIAGWTYQLFLSFSWSTWVEGGKEQSRLSIKSRTDLVHTQSNAKNINYHGLCSLMLGPITFLN